MALDRIDVLVSQKSVAWRFLNSLWIVFIIIGLGIFSIFGWLWAGILARSPKIWRIVAAWGIIVALLFISATLSENNKNFFWNALTTVLLMISWIGSLVHAFIVRGIVLREAVAREDELSRLRAYEQYYGSPQIPNHVTTNASRTMPVPASGSPLQAQGLQGLPSQSPLPPELRVDMAQLLRAADPRTTGATGFTDEAGVPGRAHRTATLSSTTNTISVISTANIASIRTITADDASTRPC